MEILELQKIANEVRKGIVASTHSAKAGHPISWGKYCKYCVPATVIVLAISMLCIFWEEAADEWK